MKVDPTGTPRGAPIRRKERSERTSEGGFADSLPRESGSASGGGATTGSGPVGGVGSLLALQEVPDAMTGRARAKQRGEELLDQLEAIRLGLLEGRLSAGQIERLAARVAERRQSVDDPNLESVLAAIEVRAAVELAKLGR